MTDKRKRLLVSELTKIFPHPSKKDTNYPLFAGATFEMSSEELNFLVGISGSGKTTLFKILASIESINAGEIFLDDLAIHKLKNNEKANYLRKIGLIDQFPAKTMTLTLTVKENLAFSLILYTSATREEREKRINEVAKNVDIYHLLEKKAIYLSGGELQRLSVACNTSHEPLLLLCDEPTAKLDVENKNKVIDVIEKVKETQDTLVIIATHDRTIIGKKPMFEIDQRRIMRCQS